VRSWMARGGGRGRGTPCRMNAMSTAEPRSVTETTCFSWPVCSSAREPGAGSILPTWSSRLSWRPTARATSSAATARPRWQPGSAGYSPATSWMPSARWVGPGVTSPANARSRRSWSSPRPASAPAWPPSRPHRARPPSDTSGRSGWPPPCDPARGPASGAGLAARPGLVTGRDQSATWPQPGRSRRPAQAGSPCPAHPPGRSRVTHAG
jgi:hypothetical protein